MTSIRLSDKLKHKLDKIAEQKHTSKSEIIRTALKKYLEENSNEGNPYKVGENLFGKYGSGQSDNSVNYKSKLKDKVRDKYSD